MTEKKNGVFRRKKEKKNFCGRDQKNRDVIHKNKKRKERGKMKNKLLIFGLVLVVSTSVVSPAHAISLSAIKQSLSKFCVPSATTCNSVYEPIFNQSKGCVCHDSTYLRYIPEKQKCVESCPAGYYLHSVADCPHGSFKFQIRRRALTSEER